VAKTVTDYLDEFEASFSFGRTVRQLFSGADAVPIYVAPAPASAQAPPGSWVMHVRLPPRLEDSFGFTRQFVVLCTDVMDLQTRAIQQLKTLIRIASPSVSSDFAMLITCDVRAESKIRDWAVERTDGLAVLAVDRDLLKATLDRTSVADALPELLQRTIAERNLYDERDPVRGDRFFGRVDELRELDRVVSHGSRHIGVFGLRRIGKTSLLLELAQRLRLRPGVIPIYLDLELSSAARSAAAAHVAHRLGDEVAKLVADRSSLTVRGARRALSLPDDWTDVEAGRLIATLGTSLANVLKGGALEGERLVLIFDESEILLPNPTAPTDHAVDLLRALRGVSQETQQLSLVIAGVNATPAEAAVIGEQDNPLFGLLSLRYLGPLEPAAADDLIKTVGTKMRIRWETPAIRAITSHVGGHPLLARLAASDVATTHRERPLRPNLATVDPILATFHTRHGDVFGQMVQSLTKYYPDELEVLRWLASGEGDLARAMLADDSRVLNHLAGYGVIDAETLKISVPALAAWLKPRGADA
jgi:hypothetical protein